MFDVGGDAGAGGDEGLGLYEYSKNTRVIHVTNRVFISIFCFVRSVGRQLKMSLMLLY